MKKILLISFLSILSYSIMAQNNKEDYRENWLKIERYQKDDLPKSALQEVDKILQLATQHKNYEQVIKALLHKKLFDNQIERSDYSALIAELDSFAKSTHNVSDKAISNLIIACLYNKSYFYYRWGAKNNTTLIDDIPKDMKEWSENIFHAKTIEHIKLALQDKDILLKDSIDKYSIIVDKGNFAARSFPTVYDFIMQEAIKTSKTITIASSNSNEKIYKSLGLTNEKIISPTDKYISLTIKNPDKPRNFVFSLYQEHLKSLTQRNLTQAIIFTELDKLFLTNRLDYEISNEQVITTLKEMLERFNDNEASNEIRVKLADILSNKEETKQESYKLCEEGLKAYPEYEGSEQLQNLRVKLETPLIELKLDKIIHPDTEIAVEYKFRNLVSLKNKGYFALTRVENGQPILVKYFKPEFNSEVAYQTLDSKLKIGKLPVGCYNLVYIQNEDPLLSFRALVEKSKEKNNYSEFIVSALASYHRTTDKFNQEIIVVDRKSGKPISDVIVTTFTNNEKSDKKTYKTDKQGLVLLSNNDKQKANGRLSYKIALDKDSCLAESYIYNSYYYQADNNSPKTDIISIFTDRSIYRPGQIVYYKALISDNKGTLVNGNQEYNVSFKDVNGKELTSAKLRSNEFGSIAGQFTIPKATLTGGFSIKIKDEVQYINVEEYKRPTFEVKFDSIESAYSYGNNVELTGNVKTFSGVNLQNAKVQYEITKQPYFMFGFGYPRGGGGYVANEEVESDVDGKFTINFVPEKSGTTNFIQRITQTEVFNVTATVTDINGETQTASYPLVVSESSIILDINITQQVEKSTLDKLEIKTTNLQQKPLEVSGEYSIYLLNDKDSIADTKVSNTFKSGIQEELKNELKQLPSGKYKIELKAKDENGKESISNKSFTLFSYNDAHPAFKTDDWFVIKNQNFNNNKPAEIIVGSSSKEAYIFYTIYNNEKVFKREFIKLNNSNQTIRVDYNNEFGDRVYLSTVAFLNNSFYRHDALLKKEEERQDKELVVKLEVFRDKLRPGQEENWTLKVTDKAGQPMIAEVLASMYDISLDKLAGYNPWRISVASDYNSGIRNANYSSNNLWNYKPSTRMKLTGLKNTTDFHQAHPKFNTINWFSYNRDAGGLTIGSAKPAYDSMAKSSIKLTGVANSQATPRANLEQVQYDELAIVEESAMDNGMMGGAGEASQIRSNFSETAFFYPQLKTNEKGETLISFKVPESNTKWRFRVLAHNQNLQQGKLEEEVVTSKELMLIPNMPRFLRQGDKTNISTKVSNLSDKNINGSVNIEFFNPVTLEIIDITIKDNIQTFNIDSGASSSASWNFVVPNDIDLLGCRIVAKSETFSDGEQHALAVLPSKILVTESMPFDIDKAGKQTFVFDKLAQKKSTTADFYRLTFEYTNNPAWYAVMAMPRLSTPSNESSTAWMHSYYVSAMSQSMLKRYPQLARMIEAWKNSDNKEVLISKLEKNEELKQILLQETPWVMDAKNETEIMGNLAQLLDENNTRDYSNRALSKLRELQSYDGGWTWFQGFNSNASITKYMLYAFYKLQSVGQVELPQEVTEMQIQALKFLDETLLKQYQSIKSENKEKYVPSIYQLEHLYVRSFYRDIPINQETRNAERFFTDQISKNWTTLGLYGKSILAVLAHNNGDKALAEKLTKSIKEYAVDSKNLGTYWPKNMGGYNSSMLAMGRHSFLMDALITNGASKEEINNMTKWIVKSKQTQKWNESYGTLYTINSLWANSPELFSNSTSPKINVGKTEIDNKNKELGTEYTKQSWMGNDITKDKSKISIDKPNDGIAFGNLTLQYYEELNKIEGSKGDLNISKKLYKKTHTEDGEALEQITDKNYLKVGDQVIVKLTIKANTDMDYIHLKDMRAVCFEPVETISQTKWAQGLFYYQTNNDASTNFFIDHINKGTYVIEYPVYVNRTGEYANGISTIQSMYSSEQVSHTAGVKVVVK